jgi:ribonuclease HII
MMICGVDEAGKGSVLGPMVVAAVACESMDELAKLGVADSKKLSKVRRSELDQKIRKGYPVSVVIITSEDIDSLRNEMTMNVIVARAHAQALDNLSCDIAYLDACDVNAERYAETVGSMVHSKCRIIASHKADDIYPAVSAASIVAKVERDRKIEELSQVYGNIGSGYPSDQITINYLKTYIQNNGRAPPIARLSWETVRQIICCKDQSTLLDF